jgi:hypothetical protein
MMHVKRHLLSMYNTTTSSYAGAAASASSKASALNT